jgi:hypothetical protein
MENALSIFDVQRARGARLADQRRARLDQPREQVESAVRRLARIRPTGQIRRPAVERICRIARDKYSIEKIVLHLSNGVVLPSLMFKPARTSGRPVLYLHQAGKQFAAARGGEIEQLVLAGRQVLAVDLLGYGETKTRPWRYSAMASYLGSNAAEYYLAYMLGRSLVGIRAEEILVAARFLQDSRRPNSGVDLIAVGSPTVPAMHASALEPSQFSTLKLVDALDSWERVIGTPITIDQLENTVRGALASYDLPDLVRLYGRDRTRVDCWLDAGGKPVK